MADLSPLALSAGGRNAGLWIGGFCFAGSLLRLPYHARSSANTGGNRSRRHDAGRLARRRPLRLPAIAHTEGREGHYVIVHSWTRQTVVVLDPNCDLVRLKRADFQAQWSGYVVEYRPTPQRRSTARSIGPLSFLRHWLSLHKGFMGLALGFALLATSLGWASSFFLSTLIDEILPNRATGLLITLGAGLGLVSGLQGLLQFGRLWLLARVDKQIHSYGKRYIGHLMRLPMSVFDA